MANSLEKFLSANKDIKKKEETDHINLENLWGDDTFICRFDKATDFKAIENVELPAEFSALYHKDLNSIEFIFGVIPPENKYLDRKFKFHYNSLEFEAGFDRPTEALKLIAIGFRVMQVKSDTDYRNLGMYSDYFKQEAQSESMKRFFKDKTPTNFFIKGDFSKIHNDFIGLAKHLNFYMRYYDRRTPTILIFDIDKEKEKFALPCHSETNEFPKVLNVRKVEPVILDLLHIANETTSVRLKYIFYYQILEYCSYYNLNEELKRKLSNIVKNPDVLNNSSHYSRQIIEEFKNYFKANDDKQKLEKLIIDYCDYDDIKIEIKCNHKYFSQDLVFDGGFKISALVKNEEESENPSKTIMKDIVDKIDRIRNVLVHIRESRENKVILPTKRNNHLLVPYLYLIRRIAEIIAIKYE
ncbi:hypothetical protein KJS94_12305 [Flavihumibacter rivuli]|uniref:hypothetical protein n=1 Tax=Flavihumibacter rivuli TaxID=2838156 RepID=UPI001BDEB6D3|nr:hypothetical protein [Flavihumibacter rivuli]ULQ55425.1 hypothetical protein KJS94_12305 [Flavihumibacter rivuli]